MASHKSLTPTSSLQPIQLGTSPIVDELCKQLREAEAIAARAKRNKHSLTGNSSEAENFHRLRVGSQQILNQMELQLQGKLQPSQQRSLADIQSQTKRIFKPETRPSDRRDVRREIEGLIRAEIEPLLLPQSPSVVELIPAATVANTRGYLEKTVRQINGCYTFEYLDACLTMVRRFFETVIIEIFEAKDISSKIKDSSGNYFMLGDLLPVLFNEPQTSVSRTTKRTLEDIAELANSSAHNRRFNARYDHLEPLRTRLAIAAEDLITLWGVRK